MNTCRGTNAERDVGLKATGFLKIISIEITFIFNRFKLVEMHIFANFYLDNRIVTRFTVD